MSKSNMSDDQADSIAVVVLISVVIAWLCLWLSGMPA